MRWHWHRWGPWQDNEFETVVGTVKYTFTGDSQYKRCTVCNKTKWKW